MSFDLEVLGGLRLVAAGGRVVQTQRRRLALLALLAAAGDRGLTRDQILGLFWPEASEDNAKHALNQLLYAIRRSLGDNALSGVDYIWLDAAVVDSDVRRFERALAAGAYAEAVQHYRGPFLNGFYLTGAPEFERRVEAERARLAAAHAAALERLAADAESRGDGAAVVTCRRTLAELDPLDARRATALMRALVAAGDSSGALAHGRAYESLVREELHAPADPAVVALTNEIRANAERLSAATAVPPSTIRAVAAVTAVDASVADVPQDRSPRSDAANNAGVPPAPRMLIRRRRRIFAYGVGVVALAVASFGATQLAAKRLASGARADAPLSIAVIALKNLSADTAENALADGITIELTKNLARVAGLRVAPVRSVFAMTDQRMDVRQITESLRVAQVLSGRFRKTGQSLQLNVSLADARGDSTRWSKSYNGEMRDIHDMLGDILRAVPHELDVRQAGGTEKSRLTAQRYTPRIEAYELYLRGLASSLRPGRAQHKRALEYFTGAVSADSNFAAAYAELARVYMGQAGETPGNHRAAHERAAWAAQKAVDLDDSLPEAHMALGWVSLLPTREWARAETEFEKALAFDPRDARALDGLAVLYTYTGRSAEHLQVAQTALQIDPYSNRAIRRVALALLMNGWYDECLEVIRPFQELSPPAMVAGVVSGQCYAAKQMWGEAITEFRWPRAEDATQALSFIAYAQARAGQQDSAKRILADLLAGRKDSHGAFGIATVYTGLRDYDSAFIWLNRAVEEESVRPYLMGPMYAELHRDPRFTEVRRRLRLDPRPTPVKDVDQKRQVDLGQKR